MDVRCSIGHFWQRQVLLKNTLAIAKASVKDTLGNAGVCVADIAGLDEAFANVQDVFQGLETTYLHVEYFQNRFNTVVRSIMTTYLANN